MDPLTIILVILIAVLLVGYWPRVGHGSAVMLALSLVLLMLVLHIAKIL